ncbi:MAG: Maf family protein, partial [Alistipes sp.]|nr:Maf family protein [Alistipes sp.]
MLLHEKLKNWKLILASQSPRRRQLLQDAGLEFQLAPRFECEESFPDTMPAEQVAEYLS